MMSFDGKADAIQPWWQRLPVTRDRRRAFSFLPPDSSDNFQTVIKHTMDKLKGLASKLGNKGEGNTAADPNAPASNANPGTTGAAGSSDKGDFLDQGVGRAGQYAGKDLSREDQEKYSDYARQGFQKGTGRDIPIKDQNIGQ